MGIFDGGPITGHFELRGHFVLDTISSAIDITVSLAPPQESTLVSDSNISSRSGPITVKFIFPPGSNTFGKHVLLTDIHSRSGNIFASLPHFGGTSISTKSGDIRAELHPYGLTARPGRIKLASDSGNMQMTVFPHIADPKIPLIGLHTKCEVSHGSVRLVYPQTWQGNIAVYKHRGPIDIDFPDVPVERTEDKISAVVGKDKAILYLKGEGKKDLDVEIVGKSFTMEEWVGAARRLGGPLLPSYEEAVRVQAGLSSSI